jgi:hypothetical protein
MPDLGRRDGLKGGGRRLALNQRQLKLRPE